MLNRKYNRIPGDFNNWTANSIYTHWLIQIVKENTARPQRWTWNGQIRDSSLPCYILQHKIVIQSIKKPTHNRLFRKTTLATTKLHCPFSSFLRLIAPSQYIQWRMIHPRSGWQDWLEQDKVQKDGNRKRVTKCGCSRWILFDGMSIGLTEHSAC